MADSESLHCYIHPDRETMLRCNSCDRPICSKCAVLTPIGYRCKACIRGQQKTFETAKPIDYIFAPLAACFLSFLGSMILSRMGFFIFFLAPLVGTGIAEIAARITNRRRSKNLFYAITGAVILGALPLLLISLLPFFSTLQSGGLNLFGVLPLIYQAAYIVLCTGSVFYRLAGIRL